MTSLPELLSDVLASIKERADKATPGPWDRHERNSNYPHAVVIETSRLKVADVSSVSDIEFIAHARTDIPRLVAALEKAIEQRNLESPECNWKSYDAEIEAILKGET